MARIRGDASIGVADLDKLAKALKAIDSSFSKELRLAGKAAADVIAPKAKAKAQSLGSTPAHVSPSIKSVAGAQFAGISGGGPAYLMFAGAEFGAGRNKPRQRQARGGGGTVTYQGYNQFQPWNGGGKGRSDGGYFMWPTIRENLPEIEDTYLEGVDKLIKKAGLA